MSSSALRGNFSDLEQPQSLLPPSWKGAVAHIDRRQSLLGETRHSVC